MRSHHLPFAAVTLFFSCSGESTETVSEPIERVKSGEEASVSHNNISIGSFSDIPEDIDGCACYFFLSKEEEQNKKYAFVNDFANIAFANINNKLEQFELQDYEENTKTYNYTNSSYGLTIRITNSEEVGHETSKIEGIITVKQGSQTVEKNIQGICGC